MLYFYPFKKLHLSTTQKWQFIRSKLENQELNQVEEDVRNILGEIHYILKSKHYDESSTKIATLDPEMNHYCWVYKFNSNRRTFYSLYINVSCAKFLKTLTNNMQFDDQIAHLINLLYHKLL